MAAAGTSTADNLTAQPAFWRARGVSEEPNVNSLRGRLLASRYRLGEQIAAGATAGIYAANDIVMDRLVAVKVAHSTWLRRAPSIRRDAMIASRIRSPHVVTILDARVDPALGYFMVMELLKGEDLEARLARVGPLPISTVCALGYQLATAMDHVHSARVIHRDLKPASVFMLNVNQRMLVKVLDFGVAKTLTHGHLRPALATWTPPGIAVGTPQYMAPEQAMGWHVDERCDIYSLGAILFEVVTGERAPTQVALRRKHLQLLPRSPPRLSTRVPGVTASVDALVHAFAREMGGQTERVASRVVRCDQHT